MIDANVNRAREGLRVVEDVARFVLNDGELSGACKALRHSLGEALAAMGCDGLSLLAARDTASDVGTTLATAGELTRSGLASLVGANAGRLTESLRVLEELAKLRSAGAAAVIERARYSAYTLHREIALRLASGKAVQWRLCVLITAALCKQDWRAVTRGAINGGADCLQLREKGLSDRELLSRAVELVGIAREPVAGQTPRHIAVIINDRPDIALLAKADGVHLGQDDLDVRSVRHMAGHTLLVGVSTHDADEAGAAIAAGADYCGVGAMFVTATKPRETSGPEYLREYLSLAGEGVPHLAIGGINAGNVAQLAEVGCRGVAVSTAVCGADDPAGACRAILAAFDADGRSVAL